MSKQKIRSYLKSKKLWDYEYLIEVDGTTYFTRIQDIVEKLFTEFDAAEMREFYELFQKLTSSGDKEIIKHFEPYAKHIIGQIAFQAKYGLLIKPDSIH